jgi:hypothetical protein
MDDRRIIILIFVIPNVYIGGGDSRWNLACVRNLSGGEKENREVHTQVPGLSCLYGCIGFLAEWV